MNLQGRLFYRIGLRVLVVCRLFEVHNFLRASSLDGESTYKWGFILVAPKPCTYCNT